VDEFVPVINAMSLVGGGSVWLLDQSEDRIRWTRPDEPPTWVWTDNGHAAGLAYYFPDKVACLTVWDLLARDPMAALIQGSARRHYADLVNRAGETTSKTNTPSTLQFVPGAC
jgi:hypothetical protein